MHGINKNKVNKNYIITEAQFTTLCSKCGWFPSTLETLSQDDLISTLCAVLCQLRIGYNPNVDIKYNQLNKCFTISAYQVQIDRIEHCAPKISSVNYERYHITKQQSIRLYQHVDPGQTWTFTGRNKIEDFLTHIQVRYGKFHGHGGPDKLDGYIYDIAKDSIKELEDIIIDPLVNMAKKLKKNGKIVNEQLNSNDFSVAYRIRLDCDLKSIYQTSGGKDGSASDYYKILYVLNRYNIKYYQLLEDKKWFVLHINTNEAENLDRILGRKGIFAYNYKHELSEQSDIIEYRSPLYYETYYINSKHLSQLEKFINSGQSQWCDDDLILCALDALGITRYSELIKSSNGQDSVCKGYKVTLDNESVGKLKKILPDLKVWCGKVSDEVDIPKDSMMARNGNNDYQNLNNIPNESKKSLNEINSNSHTSNVNNNDLNGDWVGPKEHYRHCYPSSDSNSHIFLYLAHDQLPEIYRQASLISNKNRKSFNEDEAEVEATYGSHHIKKITKALTILGIETKIKLPHSKRHDRSNNNYLLILDEDNYKLLQKVLTKSKVSSDQSNQGNTYNNHVAESFIIDNEIKTVISGNQTHGDNSQHSRRSIDGLPSDPVDINENDLSLSGNNSSDFDKTAYKDAAIHLYRIFHIVHGLLDDQFGYYGDDTNYYLCYSENFNSNHLKKVQFFESYLFALGKAVDKLENLLQLSACDKKNQLSQDLNKIKTMCNDLKKTLINMYYDKAGNFKCNGGLSRDLIKRLHEIITGYNGCRPRCEDLHDNLKPDQMFEDRVSSFKWNKLSYSTSYSLFAPMSKAKNDKGLETGEIKFDDSNAYALES